MPNSLTIGQPLAAELRLPEAQGAPAGRVFAVGRLLEWQEVRMRELERSGKGKMAIL